MWLYKFDDYCGLMLSLIICNDQLFLSTKININIKAIVLLHL